VTSRATPPAGGLWIDAGLIVVTAALVCLLPMRAREDAAHA
jgi:hypothetical protein